jgi:hypothetical protein
LLLEGDQHGRDARESHVYGGVIWKRACVFEGVLSLGQTHDDP